MGQVEVDSKRAQNMKKNYSEQGKLLIKAINAHKEALGKVKILEAANLMLSGRATRLEATLVQAQSDLAQ